MSRSRVRRNLRRACDSREAAEVLNRHLSLGPGITEAQVVKVWPKPGDRFVVLYQVSQGGESGFAVAYLFPDLERFTKGRGLKRAAPCPVWGAVLQQFPHDFRMPHLEAAVAPSRATDHVRPLLEAPGEPRDGCRVDAILARGYWPGKRCQLEYRFDSRRNGGQRLFVKVYREEKGREVVALNNALRDQGLDGRNGLAVAAALGYCEPIQAAIFEPAQGEPLSSLLGSARAEGAAQAAGKALARLHESQVPLANSKRTLRDERNLVEDWCSVLELAEPERAGVVRRLAETALHMPGVAETPCRTVHRDFHDKQVMVQGPSTATILDLDTACEAPPELDLGNFQAHLMLRGLEHHGDANRYGQLAKTFTESYRSSGGKIDPRVLVWFRNAALLRLASLYTLQPRGREYFDGLLAGLVRHPA